MKPACWISSSLQRTSVFFSRKPSGFLGGLRLRIAGGQMTYKWLGNELVLGKGRDCLGTSRAVAEPPGFPWAPAMNGDARSSASPCAGPHCWCCKRTVGWGVRFHSLPTKAPMKHTFSKCNRNNAFSSWRSTSKRCRRCLAWTPAVIQAEGLLCGRCRCLSGTRFSSMAVPPWGRLAPLLPNTLRTDKLHWWLTLLLWLPHSHKVKQESEEKTVL